METKQRNFNSVRVLTERPDIYLVASNGVVIAESPPLSAPTAATFARDRAQLEDIARRYNAYEYLKQLLIDRGFTNERLESLINKATTL